MLFRRNSKNGRMGYIVSGDKDLTDLNQHLKTRIILPKKTLKKYCLHLPTIGIPFHYQRDGMPIVVLEVHFRTFENRLLPSYYSEYLITIVTPNT